MTCASARLIRAAAVLSAIGSSAWFSEAAAQSYARMTEATIDEEAPVQFTPGPCDA